MPAGTARVGHRTSAARGPAALEAAEVTERHVATEPDARRSTAREDHVMEKQNTEPQAGVAPAEFDPDAFLVVPARTFEDLRIGEVFISFLEVSCTFLAEVHSGDTLYPALTITALEPQGRQRHRGHRSHHPQPARPTRTVRAAQVPAAASVGRIARPNGPPKGRVPPIPTCSLPASDGRRRGPDPRHTRSPVTTMQSVTGGRV